MRTFVAAIRSVIHLCVITVLTIVYALFCLLFAPLPLQWRYQFTVGWPKLILWVSYIILGIRWRVIGTENFPEGPAIVAAKHQSAWETLFLASGLPKPICYVYKRELHWIPFLGWSLALMRMIAINRKDGSNAFEQVVQQGKEQLFTFHRWVVIFPEGTRTPVGKPSRYKSGAMRLAERMQVPIIPIAINSGRLWGKNSFIKYAGEITVSIGPPLYPDQLSGDALQEKMRSWIESEMVRLNPEDYAAANTEHI